MTRYDNALQETTQQESPSPSSTEESSPLLTVRNLNIGFATGSTVHPVVHHLNLEVRRSQILAVVGESGSGKSVSALAILGLLPVYARVRGDILLGSRRLSTSDLETLREVRGRDIALVFQDPFESLDPVFSIGYQMIEAIRAVEPQLSSKQATARSLELLEQVKLPDPRGMMSRYPHQVSGGQLQRVMIALALVSHPSLIIADEPTTALDVSVQQDILDLFRDISSSEGIGVILITHDMGVVADVADTVLVMRHGECIETGEVRQIFFHPKEEYTQQLIASVPDVPSAFDTQLDEDNAPYALITAYADDGTQSEAGEGNSSEERDMLLDVRDLSVTYCQSGGESRDAVNAIGFSIAKGESLALVGESGSGKSTIAKSILGLVPHREGHIRFADQELDSLSKRENRRLRRRMGVIFQSPSRSLNPRTSIGDSIAEPLRANDGLTRVARGRVVRELIDRVQLPASVFTAYPSELSGGQLQRASIARALALEPSLLIADEPTSALDVSVQAEILELLAEIQHDSRFACLFISHDLPLVASFCNGILVLNKGKAVEQGEMKQVLSHPSQDYTRQLLLSAPLPNPDIQLRRRQSRLSA